MPPLARKYRDNSGLRNNTRGSVSKRHVREKKYSITTEHDSPPGTSCTRERYKNQPSSKSIHRSSAACLASQKENEMIKDVDLHLRSFIKGLHERRDSQLLIEDGQSDLHVLLERLDCVPNIIAESRDDIATGMNNELCSDSDPKTFSSKDQRKILQYATKKEQELRDVSKTMSSCDTTYEDLVIKSLDSSSDIDSSSDSFYSEFKLISRMEESSDMNTDLYVIHEKEEEMKVDIAIQKLHSSTSIDSMCREENNSFLRPGSSMVDTPSHDSHDSHDNSMSEEMIDGVKDTSISHLSTTTSCQMMMSQDGDTFDSPHESNARIFKDDSDTLMTTTETLSKSFESHDFYCTRSASLFGTDDVVTEPKYEVHKQNEKYQLTSDAEDKPPTAAVSKYSRVDRLYEYGKRKVHWNRELYIDRRVAEEKKSLTLEVKHRRKQAAQRLSTKPIRAEDVYARLYTKRAHSMNVSGKKLREAITKKSILRNDGRLSQYS